MQAVQSQPGRARPLSWVRHGVLVLTLLPLMAHAGLFDDEEARKAILDLRSRLDRAEQQSQQQAQQLTTQQTQQQQALAAQQQVLATRKAEADDQAEQIAVLKRSLLDLNNQLELLRAELSRLRGQDEQATQSTRDVARDLADLQRKQKDLLATLAAQDERIKRFEPQRVSLDGREVTVDSAEKKAYDDAIGVLRKGEFAKAVEAMQNFQRRFPGSTYAGHVQYWLGNAQYGKGDVKEATLTFRNLVTSSPDHPRAPEALLALANCLVELKDPKAARKTLDELVKNYPQSDAAQAGRERLTQLK
ncbi:MAG: tol-pal system protein YbgF [Leptothrix sp. (in: b-proteobacteria)]